MKKIAISINLPGLIRRLRLRLKGRYLLLSMALSFSAAQANPTNPHVVAGSASFNASNNLLEVSNAPGTIINWQDFSIASDEITRFIQQSASSAVLNRVTGSSVSAVLGSLQSNGQVFVINPNGLLIGENAVINTAGFVGSTLDIDNQAFLDQDYQFSGHGGGVENNGLIQVTGSGDVVLLGTSVANSGIIATEDGDIVLAAGRSIALTYADMDHITFKLQAADDAVLNLGQIIARGGNVGLAGGNVQQQGNIELVRSPDGRIFLQADGEAQVSGSMSAPGGHISVLAEHISLQQADISTSSANDGGEILIGGDYQGGNGVRTATTTQIDEQSSVSADATSNGDGGRIIVWSDEHTRVAGRLSARAGEAGGDGGFIETSSVGQLDVSANVSVAATNGKAGEWLLDPEDIVIDEGMATSIEGTLNEGGNVTVKTADQGDGEGNITVAAAITKTEGDDAALTLDAHNDIDVNAPISSESNKLDVTLRAGRSVDVNAQITTNGGNFATVISSVADADDVDTGADEDLLVDVDTDAAPADPETDTGQTGAQETDDAIAESDASEGTPEDEVATNSDGENADSSAVDEGGNSDDTTVDDADSDQLAEADGNTGEAESTEVEQVASDTTADDQTDEAPVADVENTPEADDAAETTEVVVTENADTSVDAGEGAEASTEQNETVEVAANDNIDAGDIATEDADTAIEQTEEIATVETISENVQVTIATAIETGGGNIEINAGNQADVAVNAVLDASNSAANEVGGSVSITTGTFLSTADIVTTGEQQGGSISIDAEQSTALGGDLIADGASGGHVEIDTGELSLAESISAQGSDGQGGSVDINVADQTIETNTSSIDVSGSSGGSIRHVAGRQITSSGTYTAVGTDGEGGSVDISAGGTKLLSANIDASGETAGGQVRVGGEYQGGKDLTEDELPNAVLLAVNDGVEIRADGLGEGSDGGNIVLWADDQAAVYGTVSAAQNRDGADVGDGGFVEISSGNVLTYAGDATAGLGGTVLFDPKDIIIDETPLSSQYALILGFNYNPIIGTLENSDLFGSGISLSSDGTRMAVAAVGDDGFGNLAINSGAVHLFSFTDGNFSGGVLESTIGKGYVGGKNMNIANLEGGDSFGSSVDLDGDGDSLAIGAWQDRGRLNSTGTNTGAVYLIKFTDTDFNGGNVEAIFGGGYGLLGGKNRSLSAGNVSESQFGQGVALNAAGDRLAIGAPGDNRFQTSNFYQGAVYLFTFSDDEFTGGTEVSKIADFSAGSEVPGANDLDLAFLDINDYLGTEVDLNAAGDRLVVAAPGDAGFGNTGGFLTGAVHMFSFSDTSFTNPTFEGTIGRGYNNIVSGPKDFDPGDIAPAGTEFGSRVSINAAGDRIAISGDQDDGFGDASFNTGIIHIIDFTDNSFSGASEERRIGFGYTGGNNVDVADLENSDRVSGVALNGTGDRLAGGWFVEDGAANAAVNSGAVRFFDLNLPGDSSGDVVDAVFTTSPGTSITIDPTKITDITNTGSAVELQANNDISVLAAILSDNPGGDGGDIIFRAGRSILIDAEIDTDNGNFTAIANETINNGAVDANRDAGAADILINADITAGTGDIDLEVRDDPTKVDNTRGVISVQSILTGNNVTIAQGNDFTLGDIGNFTPSIIDATGNVNIDIDGVFMAHAGPSIDAAATIRTDGSATISAAEIEFAGDSGPKGIDADGINLNSGSSVMVVDAFLDAEQSVVINAVDGVDVIGDLGSSLVRANLGTIDITSGSSVQVAGNVLLRTISGDIIVDATDDFLMNGLPGVADDSNLISGGALQIIAGRDIAIDAATGGTIADAFIDATGNASFSAGRDISFVGGDDSDADVQVFATDIDVDADGNVLLQGGTATNADVLLDALGNTTINALGDLTVTGGATATSGVLITADGDADFDAGSISFNGDLGTRMVDANSIDLSSDSSTMVVDAQLTADQDLSVTSFGNIDVTGGGLAGPTLLGAAAGFVDLNSGATINVLGDTQIDAAAGNVLIDAQQDFVMGNALSAGSQLIAAGDDVAIVAGGEINLLGGTDLGEPGSATINAIGVANLEAVGDISLISGGAMDADVHITAEDINLISGGAILLQGGTATNADVMLAANGTANLDAVGDLTVQGGAATGANAIVYSNSLNTINAGAANVNLLSGTGQGLLNVLDGAAGSTVNITTPGACINCVQVALSASAGVVADVVNIFGQPVAPPVAPPVEPPVEPPIVVVPPAAPTVPDPVEEPPIVVVPPELTEPDTPAEPEVAEVPDDIINEVLVLNSNDDSADAGAQTASTAGDGEEDGESETEEKATQCKA